MDDATVRRKVVRTEELLAEIERLDETRTKDLALETLQALFELYGEGLSRMIERSAKAEGGGLVEAYLADELVRHLLLMHGLHPVALDQRVLTALQGVRPYLESHGGGVELVEIAGGVAHVRLQGSCRGCPSSATTLRQAVEKAVLEAAPDLLGIEAEEVVDPPPPPQGFVQICGIPGSGDGG